jgi:hypothetical protein
VCTGPDFGKKISKKDFLRDFSVFSCSFAVSLAALSHPISKKISEKPAAISPISLVSLPFPSFLATVATLALTARSWVDMITAVRWRRQQRKEDIRRRLRPWKRLREGR